MSSSWVDASSPEDGNTIVADLHGSVPGVLDPNRGDGAPPIDLDIVIGPRISPGTSVVSSSGIGSAAPLREDSTASDGPSFRHHNEHHMKHNHHKKIAGSMEAWQPTVPSTTWVIPRSIATEANEYASSAVIPKRHCTSATISRAAASIASSRSAPKP